MFGLGASAVFGRASLQGFDDVLRDVANEELGHTNLHKCYHMIAIQRRPIHGRGGKAPVEGLDIAHLVARLSRSESGFVAVRIGLDAR